MSEILRLEHVLAATASDRRMNERTYHGFRLGPRSHHDELEVDLDGQTYLVGAGDVVTIDPTRGRPVMRAVRSTFEHVLGGDARSVAELVGLTCPAELGAPAQRAAYRLPLTTLVGVTGVTTRHLIVPMAGRRCCRFKVKITGDAVSGQVIGLTYAEGVGAAAGFDALATAAAGEYNITGSIGFDANADVTIHVGGLGDELEEYDAMAFELSGDAAHSAEVAVRAV